MYKHSSTISCESFKIFRSVQIEDCDMARPEECYGVFTGFHCITKVLDAHGVLYLRIKLVKGA